MAGPANTPEDVLGYWFGDNDGPLDERVKFWFGGGPDADSAIDERFASLLDRLAGGEAHDWAKRGALQRLAAVIVLDQFSRNIHRGSARAFDADPIARDLVKDALAAGEDRSLSFVQRWFLYMPLEHSEDPADQERSVALFAQLAAEAPEDMRKAFAGAHDYAVQHADVIRRFGRFPHRNKALGRATTPEEQAWLDQGGGF